MARVRYLVVRDGNSCRIRFNGRELGPLPEAEARRLAIARARAAIHAGRTAQVLVQDTDETYRTEWIRAPFGAVVEA